MRFDSRRPSPPCRANQVTSGATDGGAGTRFTTPPIASLPNSTPDGPLVTSTRPAASVLRRPMSRVSMSAPAIGSPSTSTSTRASSIPRMESVERAGTAGSSWIPGCWRSSWLAPMAAAASMAARSSTSVLRVLSPPRSSRWPAVVVTVGSIAGSGSIQAVRVSGAGAATTRRHGR